MKIFNTYFLHAFKVRITAKMSVITKNDRFICIIIYELIHMYNVRLEMYIYVFIKTGSIYFCLHLYCVHKISSTRRIKPYNLLFLVNMPLLQCYTPPVKWDIIAVITTMYYNNTIATKTVVNVILCNLRERSTRMTRVTHGLFEIKTNYVVYCSITTSQMIKGEKNTFIKTYQFSIIVFRKVYVKKKEKFICSHYAGLHKRSELMLG